MDVGELLVERGGDRRPLRVRARLVGEQHRQLVPQPLLGGDRTQATARLEVARRAPGAR